MATTAQQVPGSAAAVRPRIDVQHLAEELRSRVRAEVRFDDGSRALYATDASNYRQPPIGVVIPRDLEDVVRTIETCRSFGAPILPRGGGTSLAGQCCNVAVIIDFSKYLNSVLELDREQKTARVQPGTILDTLRNAAEEHKLTFGPDPATHTHCVLGGMIGNNSCGIHAVMAGRTAENVEELEILTYDGVRMRVGPTSDEELERIIREGGRRGEIYAGLRSLRDRYADQIRNRYPKWIRWVSGYNLPALLPENGFNVARALVGTEGTCATVLEAKVRLVDSPPGRVLLVLGYPDVYTSADHVPSIMEYQPLGLEGLDDRLVGYMEKKGLRVEHLQLLPDGRGWLIAEFGGQDRQAAEARAREVMETLKQQDSPPTMKVYTDPEDQARVWEVRESGLGATAYVPGMPDTWPGWEDSSVPPEHLGEYLRGLRGLLDKYGYQCSLYGHFGQGCLHTRIDFDLVKPEGIRTYRAFLDEAADLVLRYGGSLSGEHGDGQARAELLPKMYGEELVRAFQEFKGLWDPDNKMNPGKVVEPYRITENLRLGADYNPARPKTHFSFAEDGYSFSHATLRCVGVGKCRREGGGVMCPSYMVTREEKHTTRGRAHLLFEMLMGEVITDGWRSEEVKEALDLCLSCKGCKGDCPVNVDIATYKAEFLSHYYAGRLRPRSAYAFGFIMYWARLASLAPGLVNFFTQTPLLADVAKVMARMPRQRKIPKFARRTFKSWWRDRPAPREEGRPRVILWPDTFNNFFHPQIAAAGVEVLGAAGYEVVVPRQSFCCGRPFYEFGFLDQARDHLRRILDGLRPQIRAGMPVVVLEPSCASVFRDELLGLFPQDYDAQRLSAQTYLLSEFLEQKAPDFRPPKLKRKAIVQGHCHHQSVLKMDAEEAVLGKLGLEYEVLDSGCCGMAGAFGFEQGDPYEVSIKEGERVLLPAVRQAERDTLVLANGFSCQEQIAQGSERRALHLAQVLQMALRGDGDGRGEPEAGLGQQPASERLGAGRRRAAMVGAGVALAGGAVGWGLGRKRR